MSKILRIVRAFGIVIGKCVHTLQEARNRPIGQGNNSFLKHTNPWSHPVTKQNRTVDCGPETYASED